MEIFQWTQTTLSTYSALPKMWKHNCIACSCGILLPVHVSLHSYGTFRLKYWYQSWTIQNNCDYMESNVKPKGSQFWSSHKWQIPLKNSFLQRLQIHVTIKTKCPGRLLAWRVNMWLPTFKWNNTSSIRKMWSSTFLKLLFAFSDCNSVEKHHRNIVAAQRVEGVATAHHVSVTGRCSSLENTMWTS